MIYCGYFYIFFCGLGDRDSRGNIYAPEIFQPWAGKWSAVYPVRCGSCCNVCGLAGADRAMALLFASLYAAVTEFIAGKLIERFYHKRWWDYSKSKWNLDGYICLPVSLIKGALGYVVVKYANRWVFRLLAILPQLLVHIVLLVLIGVLVVDVLASYLLVTGKSRHPEKWLEANNKIDRFRIRLGNKIAGSIENE